MGLLKSWENVLGLGNGICEIREWEGESGVYLELKEFRV